MILSLLKILFFFAVVLALTLFAVNLSETGEAVRLVFQGVEYTLGPVQAFLALVLLAIAGWLGFKIIGLILAFLRFLMGDQTAIDRYFARSRRRKGYEALAEGMLAVASGEGRLAQEKATRAARFLNQPHITNVLSAQAAEVAGDTAAAEAAYRRMLGDDRTRFVAVRGLMRQKLDAGDTATALKLAEKAYAIKPSHQDVQDTLLKLQTEEGDWKGARGVLKDKRRQGRLPQDVHIRRDAVLALQEAKDVLAHENSISAQEAAISACRASPDLIPAAVLAARSYMAKDDPRNAGKILQKTWKVRPHPAIAAAYAEIVPDEGAEARLKRFEDLMRQNPEHEETRLLRAELNIAAEHFPEAKRALGDLAEVHPTTRSLAIRAAIARGEGAPEASVRDYLARALTASRGPQWVCDKCHNTAEEWAPVCESCGGFDTLSWREPEGRVAPATAPGVMPMLMGRSPQELAAAMEESDAYREGAADEGGVGMVRDADKARGRVTQPPLAPSDTTQPDTAHPTASQTKGAQGPLPVSAPKEGGNGDKAVVDEVALVKPGMVPRESDWVPRKAPSSTVTAPEVGPETTPKAVGPAAGPVAGASPTARPVELRANPDAVKVEPGKPRQKAKVAPYTTSPALVDEDADVVDVPVRPDVEPPEDLSQKTQKPVKKG